MKVIQSIKIFHRNSIQRYPSSLLLLSSSITITHNFHNFHNNNFSTFTINLTSQTSTNSQSSSSSSSSSQIIPTRLRTLSDQIAAIENISPNFGKNQHIPIDNESNEKLKKILHNFNAPIRYAFAYGSGVFFQKGYDEKSKPMIDFIFAVSYPQHWHSLNLKQNKNHYSFIRNLGSGAISSLQENVGAGIYFNPYVQMDDMVIKYGVISINKMCQDLLDWENLYISGRMQKPIKILRDDARVRLAQQVNLSGSLRTALLLLPKDFTEEQLYLTIAAISFKGDFRRFIGENPNKIKNVVSTQINNFNLLYSSLIHALPNVTFIDDNNLQQDDSPKARAQMIQKLPRILKNKVQEEYKMAMIRKGITLPSDEKEIFKNIASSEDYPKYIETGLRQIIFWPAITQSLKGILTAGMFKSGKYISNKLGKWMFRQ
ncbi:hypothetical protein Glove_456g24 [Diversispora epigaea]|uniref:Phosphatidate cytidylyltransferase, mitochondrial n=1 Tax=Diversispora epigaea TaxID=1348612 RepID=A0A397GT96_9GLOM|nr:hypothetical protein Glove_456g24 [Diversispora epigaea]